jgi:AraC family transcriptional regulator
MNGQANRPANRPADRPECIAVGLVHALADAQVIQVSPEADWGAVAATRFRFKRLDISLPALGVPAFGINYGPEMQLERTLHGRRVSGRGVAGHLSLLPPHSPSRWVFDKPGDVALVLLNPRLFEAAIAEVADRALGAVEIMPEFAIRDLTLERIAHHLLKAIAVHGAGGRLHIELLAQELAGHIMATHTNLELEPGTTGRSHAMAPSRLKRAEAFILENLPVDISLKDIAAAAGMSVFHFAKAFKQATGRSPYGYVTEQRLHHARSLLHDRKLSVGQVAQAVGFSHARFTTVFRRNMRMTPTEFRTVLHT